MFLLAKSISKERIGKVNEAHMRYNVIPFTSILISAPLL